ncbi:toll/interleukin-1 receptor domain-containing protein [Tengunoibacter tsumagoiensis]|uniref:TIR domain-containing protein n=1 Tax=Tengunoibacter tsumagoiensis TaxID=2014871 RepID=A0A402A9P3_9CHLR|nr:toll/interleukin-1 receptor domain-containing protein [Tengunoibacter tsumagoiensis]GCE15675.1 hypothetical protein KTT_55340 [Tengunoibacter tsumagoiensis]
MTHFRNEIISEHTINTSSDQLLSTEPLKIFFSYAHEDHAFRSLLGKHLMPFVRSGLVTQWYDGDIHAGAEWAEEVYAHLNTADIILFLVSPDFMNSDFCYHVEMARALERNALKETRAIAILLRPTYWQETLLGDLQVLPRGEMPVSIWHDHDQAFFSIVQDIYAEITLLLSQKWLETSNNFQDAKDYEYALRACQKAIQLNPRNSSAYLNAGTLFWHLRQYEEALTAYEQVIQLEPTNSIAHVSRCYALWNLGHYQLALHACEQAILLQPDNSTLYLIQAQLYELLKVQALQKARQLDGAAIGARRNPAFIAGPSAHHDL